MIPWSMFRSTTVVVVLLWLDTGNERYINTLHLIYRTGIVNAFIRLYTYIHTIGRFVSHQILGF